MANIILCFRLLCSEIVQITVIEAHTNNVGAPPFLFFFCALGADRGLSILVLSKQTIPELSGMYPVLNASPAPISTLADRISCSACLSFTFFLIISHLFFLIHFFLPPHSSILPFFLSPLNFLRRLILLLQQFIFSSDGHTFFFTCNSRGYNSPRSRVYSSRVESHHSNLEDDILYRNSKKKTV